MTFQDGSYYEGHFQNNIYNGKGKMVWADTEKYEGNWVNGKMDGIGVFTYQSK